MSTVFEIATNVSTPLMLAGFFAAAFFFTARQVIRKGIFPQLSRQLSSDLLRLIIDRLFVLSLVAMVLGFAGFVLGKATTTVPPAASPVVPGAISEVPPHPPAIPGDTGWIFAGYFNTGKERFSEGPYVEVLGRALTASDQTIELGDTIRLTAKRGIVIVDFKKSYVAQKLVSPIKAGIIEDSDNTGVVLPKGTVLVVRDISRGRTPGNPNVAVWLRVIHVPR